MEGQSSILEQSPAPTFERQYANIERVNSQAGHIEIVDVTPQVMKDQTPILLASGWGETPTTHKDTLKTIFSEGRRAINLKFPRISARTISFNEYPTVEVNKAVALIEALDSKGIKQVDIIAHSEGAINAIILAQLEPGMVRNLVLVDPAGLVGQDNVAKLATRFSFMLLKDSVRNITDPKKASNRLRAAKESAKYFLRNPKLALQEAHAISQADIYEMLTNLRQQGVGISIMHGVDDTVFPMNKLLDEAKRKGGVDTIGFYSVKGDHRQVSVHPERYTALAVNALENLARRSQGIQEQSNLKPTNS